MTTPVRILGIPGSLRRGSYNRLLLHAAAEAEVDGVELTVHDGVADIPVFNQDREDPAPASVTALRDAVASADGLLIATPEYSRSIPGGLKNLLDWLSRGDTTTFGVKGRPVAVIGATTGMWGTRASQEQVRQVLANIGADVLYGPLVYLPHAADAFDGTTLTDERTRTATTAVVEALRDRGLDRRILAAAHTA